MHPVIPRPLAAGLLIVLVITGLALVAWVLTNLLPAERIMYYQSGPFYLKENVVDRCKFVDDKGKRRPCKEFSREELSRMAAAPSK
ncbi:hypothetical protein HY972_01680 [Candidatus Kaiserbacteria bacterium]|nr:hypothetical protein [Candidatus Kaiserbacteria bacterium]